MALWLIGGLGALRAILLVVAQLAGGIAGAALVAALTPFGGAQSVTTTLGPGVNIGQGLFIEAFLTATLVLTVLFLAAEKHRSTYLAPIGIGLVLLSDHLFGVAWTGCGINPARSFGPAVVSGSFPGYHWIYWVGPLIGTLLAVGFYLMLKAFDYTSVVFGQDADHEVTEAERHVVGSSLFRRLGRKFVVYHTKEGAPRPTDSIVMYDSRDPAMQEAIRHGKATIVVPADMEAGVATEAAADGKPATAPQLVNGVPSMRPEAQDVGGLQVPGTTSGG